MKLVTKMFSVFLLILLMVCPLWAQELNDKIDELMVQFINLDQFSGSVLLAKDGEILYAKAFGEADKDFHVNNTLNTKYNIGSIGKTFTGISIMQLAEQNKLNVSDPVIKHLIDFPYGDKITIHHLLSHTAGTFNYFAHPDFAQQMFRIRSVGDALPLIYDQELRFETPGEQFSYSNSGIVILGAIIEKLSGQTYADYLKQNILTPAGMNDTGINYLEDIVENRAVGYTKSISGEFKRNIFRVPPANADGGIETTVLDMLKYDQALYGSTLLNEKSKQKMFTPNLEKYGYCFGITEKFGNIIVGHGGGTSGVSAAFHRYLDDRYVIIVMANYSGAAGPVSRGIEAIIFGVEYPKPKPLFAEFIYQKIAKEGLANLVDNFQTIIQKNGYQIRSSGQLNMVGYTFIQEKKNQEAIEIFKLNVTLFPDEANPYDSLAEAYMLEGKYNLSRKYYNKALEVDPTFDNAKQMLERLNELEKK